ncbi:arginine transporter permease ArtM [Salmonella enterica subsp. enterica]|uniref:Arginine transporter permease ArtM n=1 Tax=Salmonella enterica I TaxID=59201 RepID=A0A3S4HXZ3_SALET|nr:arginine transporter permease ArtM [Salmonella enterica subsp. enterica]
MLEYLPELLKGLHTSLTLTVASIAVALVLALVFYHYPDTKNAVRGVAGARLYHVVYRYAVVGANFPDLLRTPVNSRHCKSIRYSGIYCLNRGCAH